MVYCARIYNPERELTSTAFPLAFQQVLTEVRHG
jgi:hypothetical protein